MRRIAMLVIGVSCTPLLLAAQAATPAGCARATNDWFNTAYHAARDSAALPGGKPANTRALLDQRTARTRACAAQFTVEGTAPGELLDLAALYSSVGLDSLAGAAIDRRLADPALSESDRAAGLVARISALTRPDTLLVVRAEPYMAQLDAMSGAVWRQKLEGHQILNSEYRYLDVNPRIRQHSLAIIGLGKSIKAAAINDRSPGAVSSFTLLDAYANLGEVYADFGHVDSTMLALDQARIDHPEIPDSEFRMILGPERERYALVGQRAATLAADHWLNAAPATRTMSPAGHVTVMEFTAHWCVPCRNSYPSMVAMADAFGRQGVQFLFATQFYGYIGTRQGLDSAAEFAGDREYFVGEHGIHFPVAIGDASPPYQPGKPFVQDPNFDRYQVGGIPQTVIVDRNGIIRRILTGWDTGNAQRIPVLLSELLREKTPAKSPPP
jgi:thiol-disulfide isomerase/thioredoxin